MISRDTIKALSLKSLTRAESYDFYIEVNSEFNDSAGIEEAISWWQDNPEKLNRLWWVLNYYSEKLDPERTLRAIVEKTLDFIHKSLPK
ncbi:MAG: hypothetical protein B6I26_03410 [Desulfobacteraceae bacterium 4572_130]|nr:MAG: hypothetical protein B6I26_03410 [Desulfobacteraceae bacterium 4572_130]